MRASLNVKPFTKQTWVRFPRSTVSFTRPVAKRCNNLLCIFERNCTLELARFDWIPLWNLKVVFSHEFSPRSFESRLKREFCTNLETSRTLMSFNSMRSRCSAASEWFNLKKLASVKVKGYQRSLLPEDESTSSDPINLLCRHKFTLADSHESFFLSRRCLCLINISWRVQKEAQTVKISVEIREAKKYIFYWKKFASTVLFISALKTQHTNSMRHLISNNKKDDESRYNRVFFSCRCVHLSYKYFHYSSLNSTSFSFLVNVFVCMVFTCLLVCLNCSIHRREYRRHFLFVFQLWNWARSKNIVVA